MRVNIWLTIDIPDKVSEFDKERVMYHALCNNLLYKEKVEFSSTSKFKVTLFVIKQLIKFMFKFTSKQVKGDIKESLIVEQKQKAIRKKKINKKYLATNVTK